MNRVFAWMKQHLGGWRLLVLCLGLAAAGGTTYMLVLPALTVDMETADEMSGLVVGGAAEAVAEAAAPVQEEPQQPAAPEQAPAPAAGEQVSNDGQEVPAAAEQASVQEAEQQAEAAPQEDAAQAHSEDAGQALQEEAAQGQQSNETQGQHPVKEEQAAGSAGTADDQAEAKTAEIKADPDTDMTEETEEETEEKRYAVSPLYYACPDYEVRVSFDESDKLPESTSLKVNTYTKDSSDTRYASYFEHTEKQFSAYDETVGILYELKLTDADDNKIEPAHPVDIEIVLRGNNDARPDEMILSALYEKNSDRVLLVDKNYDGTGIITTENDVIKKIHIKNVNLNTYDNVVGLFALAEKEEETDEASKLELGEMSAPETDPVFKDASYIGTVEATSLNLRAEADIEAEVLGLLDNGARIGVLEIMDNGWSRVLADVEGEVKEGFVKTEYLRLEENEKVEENTTEEQGEDAEDTTEKHDEAAEDEDAEDEDAEEKVTEEAAEEVAEEETEEVTEEETEEVTEEVTEEITEEATEENDSTKTDDREADVYTVSGMGDGYAVNAFIENADPDAEYSLTISRTDVQQSDIEAIEEALTTELEDGTIRRATVSDPDNVVILDITLYKDGEVFEPDGSVRLSVGKAGVVPARTMLKKKLAAPAATLSSSDIQENSAVQDTLGTLQKSAMSNEPAVQEVPDASEKADPRENLIEFETIELPEEGVIHFTHDQGTELLAAENGSFTTENFSRFAVGYTVDFETVKGGKYSIPGKGSYKLNDLLPAITGEEGVVSDAALELFEGELEEGALYLTQDENNDWYINSDAAFDDTYLLTMIVGEVTYEIKVTDAEGDAAVVVDPELIQIKVNKIWNDGLKDLTPEEAEEAGLSSTVKLVEYRTEKKGTTLHFIFKNGGGPVSDLVVDNNSTVQIATGNGVGMSASTRSDATDAWQTASGQNGYIVGNPYGNSKTHNIPVNDQQDIYVYFWGDPGEVSVPVYTAPAVGVPDDPSDVPGETITLTAPASSGNFYNLPLTKEIDGTTYNLSYAIEETSPESGYTAEYKIGDGEYKTSLSAEDAVSGAGENVFTVKNTANEVDITAIKAWMLSDGSTAWPEGAEVSVTLYQTVGDGEKTPVVISGSAADSEAGAVGNPVTLTADSTTVTWENLPRTTEDNEVITYSVEETGVTGFSMEEHGFVCNVSQNPDGSFELTNTPCQKVQLQKTWDEHVTDGMAWEADFVLEELEYPYADRTGHITYNAHKAHDNPEAEDSWHEVTPRTVFTMSNTSGTENEALNKLPKFRTNEDGSVSILMYSVTEIGYKVWANSNTSAPPLYQWSKDEGYHGDIHFTPEYVEDADEFTDYLIEVNNSERNVKEDVFINFDLKKTWAPADDPAVNSGSYAIFQLKRKSHQEFKKLNDPEVDYTQFVTVRLVDAGGRELTSLQVEKNAQIKFQAAFKTGIDGVGTVDFVNTDGTTGHVTLANGNTLPNQTLITSQPFRVNHDATFQYVSGENYLADGLYGIVISDRCDGVSTAETDDASFNDQNYTYTVDADTGYVIGYENGTLAAVENTNGWTLQFNGLPQLLVDTGSVQEVTTVYGYYFEEIASNPDWDVNFYQADSSGKKTSVINGDENNRIYFDDHVIAENKKNYLKIKKYWESLVQSEMPNVVVDIKRVETDGINVNVNKDSPSYKKVILTADNNFEYELYNLETTRPGGYYAYIPIELGVTSSKPGDAGVNADGEIVNVDEVEVDPIDSQCFNKSTYIMAKNGDTIDYTRIKADQLAKEAIQNVDQSIRQEVITSGSGTICIVNNPKKFEPQMDIRKRWHKFTTDGGMTTESNYNGAYFTVMLVQIVKDADSHEEIKRIDYGTQFEWHYDGNNSFHYYDEYHNGNVSIDYHNGTWHVTIHEGQGIDGSNLPIYGFYTDKYGVVHKAEYDYTFREVSITSTDGYPWALSDHIQSTSDTSGAGHDFFLDNYPDADLKIIKHWPTIMSNQGVSAVYFEITDRDRNNIIKKIAEEKSYKEHQLTAGDVAEINGTWCLIVRGPVNSTEDWIGYVDHLPLFDFKNTVFNDNGIAGAMPGEINYNVREVAALNSEGVIVPSENLYIPYYQVTTRGKKGAIQSHADGVQLGMYDEEKQELQPTIVEVTNNATENFELEKKFYDEHGMELETNTAGEPKYEDNSYVTKVQFVMKVTAETTTTTVDGQGNSTSTTTSETGYVGAGFKTATDGHRVITTGISGAQVFELTAASKDVENRPWTLKPEGLQGLPTVEVSGGGNSTTVTVYTYEPYEKAVYSGEKDITSEFGAEYEIDEDHILWTISNTKQTTGSLQVTKTVKLNGSEDSEHGNAALTFYVGLFENDTQTAANEGTVKAITVAAGSATGIVTYDNLKIGQKYYVYETDQAGNKLNVNEQTQGYTVTVNGGQSDPIAVDPIANVNVENNKELVDIEASKIWKSKDVDITAAIKNASVTLKLMQSTDGTSWTEVVPATAGETNPQTITAGDTALAAWKASWTNLPKYTDVNGTAVLIQYKVVEKAAKVNTEDDVLASPAPEIVIVDEAGDYAAVSGGNHKASGSVTNRLTDFEFIKIWTTGGGSPQEWHKEDGEDIEIEVTLKRRLRFNDGKAPGLGDEETVWTKKLKSSDAIDAMGNAYKFKFDGLAYEGSTGEGEDMRTGIYEYYITEKWEAGTYNEPKYFKAGSESGTSSATGTTDSGGKIQNDMISVALPETGGPGTMGYTFGGIMLMALSVVMYMLRRKMYKV